MEMFIDYNKYSRKAFSINIFLLQLLFELLLRGGVKKKLYEEMKKGCV